MYNYTGSVGISMLWWGLGAIVAISGILVYMELGLTLPLYNFEGEGVVSVPRNGGELNYVGHSQKCRNAIRLTRNSSNIYSRNLDTLLFVFSA